jgi:energy-coupling factor transport system ATP-binding protein
MDIEITSLTFTYPSGVRALDEVSLRIRGGESLALIGQNGAGKTTLVKHLNGLLRAETGSVMVGGWDLRQRSVAQMAARVGFVFQNPDDQLFQRTIWEEMLFGPRNLGWPAERAESQARAALQLVGLEAAPGRHPYDLTPSARKLLALACVLAMDTPVLVLDEPTTGQDHLGVQRIGNIVDGLRAQGKTVIGISHDIDFCAEHFERVVIMAGGRILLDAPARQALAQADILAQTDVEPPQLMRLAAGLVWQHRPLTVAEFVEHWMMGAGVGAGQ